MDQTTCCYAVTTPEMGLYNKTNCRITDSQLELPNNGIIEEAKVTNRENQNE